MEEGICKEESPTLNDHPVLQAMKPASNADSKAILLAIALNTSIMAITMLISSILTKKIRNTTTMSSNKHRS
jgi:hypothetical protein